MNGSTSYGDINGSRDSGNGSDDASPIDVEAEHEMGQDEFDDKWRCALPVLCCCCVSVCVYFVLL